MPRGRCHFALLAHFHEELRRVRPVDAALMDRHLPELIAGAAAPDGLRYVAKMGKFATHFYTENRRETWGQAVDGLFRAHPDLADPGQLTDADRALVLGYISHLTVDEVFRDVVTVHVHGTEDWRPVIEGLWSMVDELPIRNPDYESGIDRFERRDPVGFIDCAKVGEFLALIRPWMTEGDPWEVERIYLQLIGSEVPEGQARQAWMDNRMRAAIFLDGQRRDTFVAEAVRMGMMEAVRFLDGENRSDT